MRCRPPRNPWHRVCNRGRGRRFAPILAAVWLVWAPDLSVAEGRALYQTHCASCHGLALQGQPDWQTPLPSGRMPAPPHDASGHTWHHADSLLFRIIAEGTAAVVGGGYESGMPGFAAQLTPKEIRAVIAFIKST